MTQPVQEPTEGRAIAGLKWQTSQLFRRPAPPPPSGGGSQVMVPKYGVAGCDWRTMINSPMNNFGSFTRDSTAPFGGYISGGGSDGDSIVFGLPLGPAGSGWAVSIWAENGPSAGKLQIEWATTSVDEFAAFGYGSDVSIIDPLEDSSTFYKATNSGASAALIDWYSGSTGWGFVDLRSAIVISGTDGQMLAADGTANGDWFYGYDMLGGGDPSVYWWCQLRVDGKNASSSGYDMKIAGVSVYRINGNGQPIT